MPDREKVIKGLECHVEGNCVECPYRDGWRTCPFGETLLVDALAFLKEQEPVVRCKDCEMNNQCSIQFKFADPDDPEEWYCANGKRHEGS